MTTSPSSGRSQNSSPDRRSRGEPDARERARPVRRAAAGRPTAQRLHGVPPSTQHLPLPAEAASALFQVVSQRYLKTSIVLITNRGVASWGEVLGDVTVAAAMLDRLLHRSVVLATNGTQTVLA